MINSNENNFGINPPVEKKRLKKIKRSQYPDAYQHDLIGDQNDEEYLANLTHLEKEKVLAERHHRREQLIKENNLREEFQKKKYELGDDLLNYSLTKRGLSIIKDESKDFTERQAPLSERTKYVKKIKKFSIDPKIGSNENINLLNKICATRTFLFQIINHLYFEKAIKNCLVKIHFGNKNGQNNYKIGIINKIIKKDEEKYLFEGKYYNTYLEVLNENNKKWEVKLCNVSNQEIDWPEGYKLLEKLTKVVDFELDMDWVEYKIEELDKFMNYKFTSEDIVKIKEKQLGDKIPETEEEFFKKKKLLETKLNFLEDRNFHSYSEKKEEEILDLKKKIKEIKEFLTKKEKISAKKFLLSYTKKDKYLKFNNIKKEERVVFERNTENPLNMWTIDGKEIQIDKEEKKIKNNNDINKKEINEINQKIYNDLMKNFLNIFQRDLPIDDLIENIIAK